MFILVTLSDLIQIDPWHFTKPSRQAIEDNIHGKYANKVIQNVGLCVCLWDLLTASEGLISQGSGQGKVNVNVEFRLVVFRPFRGEIVQGVIKSSDPEGIRVGLDFFFDVWIPASSLFEGCKYTFRENKHVWMWTTEAGDEFFFDKDEAVRFRVEAEVWHDLTPQKPSIGEESTARTGSKKMASRVDASTSDVPYTIIGSMQQQGLGPIFWW